MDVSICFPISYFLHGKDNVGSYFSLRQIDPRKLIADGPAVCLDCPEAAFKMFYPHFFFGYDKYGRPVLYDQVVSMKFVIHNIPRSLAFSVSLLICISHLNILIGLCPGSYKLANSFFCFRDNLILRLSNV